jgi:hypothetical protein
MDSFLLGCIPVLFMETDEFDRYLPGHFHGWARNASVLVDPELFLHGKMDLFELLSSMSRRRIGRMQTLIAHNARRLVYSLDYVRNDALDVMTELQWQSMLHDAHGGTGSSSQYNSLG